MNYSDFIDNSRMDADILAAVESLKDGKIIGFPTETYYGLGVDPYNTEAVDLLYTVKKRNRKKPILVLINDMSELYDLVEYVPVGYETLIKTYWPGPLSLLFHANKSLPRNITGNTGTIGVRMTPHTVAQEIIRIFGGPVTATSANLAGKAPALTAEQTRKYFGQDISCIIDGGTTRGQSSSTIVSLLSGKLELIREGVIDFEEILKMN